AHRERWQPVRPRPDRHRSRRSAHLDHRARSGEGLRLAERVDVLAQL
ncbi:MAG: hypothetical protein AVDCRST_MAG67-4153, partial [uncultured Solirubrobacteraceae bacterium]